MKISSFFNHFHLLRKTICLLLPLLLLMGCEKQIIICLSSSPDVAYLIEKFNVSQKKYKMTFNYASDPREPLNQRIFPDIIIDWNIQDTSVFVDYETLPSKFSNKKKYYPDLIEMGKVKNKYKFMPLCFNLPLVAYTHVAGEDEFPKVQTLESIATNAATYNQKNRWEYTRLGLSPLWDPNFLFFAYTQFGLHFVPMNKGFYADGLTLQTAQEKIDQWAKVMIPDIKLEKIYRDKYHRYPGYTLLEKDLALFYYFDTKDYFNIPPESRSKLSFSWISEEKAKAIPALEDVLFAAIPEQGHSKKGAIAFLKWICDEETQISLIQEKNKYGLDAFGLLNGFSAIISVNENFYPIAYPILKGRLPSSNEIIFPTELPCQLIEAKNEIIKKWMVQKVEGVEEWDLGMEIDRWLRFQPISR